MAGCPNQLQDENNLASGFFTVEAGSAQVVATGGQSTVFSTTEHTALLLAAEASFRYEIGTDPTASATTHLCPNGGPMTLWVGANEKVSVFGTSVTISVVK